ncbi:MAG: protein-L-isoaspartate O-methyltransferase [Pseudolabrys sp.]|nr:protein-L-isoaspartate O-methyltransferase [Pseudolabrys sp.]
MTDFAAARRNMVDGQVRTADVTDQALLAALLAVPRERYVPPGSRPLAYLDLDLPAGEGPGSARRLLKPMVLAKLLQAAEIGPADRVLCIGCAYGYAAAVVAGLAGEVVALEEEAGLAAAAREALAPLPNVSVVSGPLTAGWPALGPYDVILIEGATEVEPRSFRSQLTDGGRLVCVLGAGPGAKATLYRRSGDDIGGRPIFDAAAAVLPGFVKPPAFAF